MPLPLAYGEVAEMSRRRPSRGWAGLIVRAAIDLLAIVAAGSIFIVILIAAGAHHG